MTERNPILVFSVLFIFISFPLYAANYLATTLWVKGIVELAGVENVRAFAPADMKHPPEYELSPSDILELSRADVVFIAGYERRMVGKISESFTMGGKKFRIVKINTENSFENLAKEAGKVAKEFGTERKYKINIAELEKLFIDFKNKFAPNDAIKKSFYVHCFQHPVIKSFGIDAAGTFGPEQISSKEIGEVSKFKSVIIIDNVHNPVGKVLTDANINSKYTSFINFPGMFGTKTIMDVIRYNKAQLEFALK
jgi:zinc transport system substrate-binding protein